MSDFNISLEEIKNKSVKHTFTLPNQTRPTAVHLHYMGDENPAWEKRSRSLTKKANRMAQMRQAIPMKEHQTELRKLMAGTIVWKVEDCPKKNGKFVNITKQEELEDFCLHLADTFMAEIIQTAGDMDAFYADAATIADAEERGEKLGES